ncbi:succinate-semialdehyde dehydrogenase/glutarate-semialdehyde dehydrogenase [Halohasta litchfieldiae]|jgi:succinate-semialdehyde dehydrogenase/glutarate-semialdehyde dehydrogenase|uniref:Succinate-semialdehyde dehydrogenase / glutarate-semialdehyde dehydrogenase n=1 Tax=Halohasta litchfieldiae TaxID=1073996 RepID=A0A1H6RRI5_9EURY|nr:NAD-dependent succinate-semialdehyde dehydrogenase [Halohasta litchfieldiae]ATW89637.1 succinate-semialdehyde dehydrogenase/glutarate-semialdehyde dehydrogenase [Halohasta litchfieldiae]SEI55127.1 succinate-semialdehyde dehydrogenase / glutarate-semialdehyde dehydrogenase [Halohasta litchfieldiae]
MESINPATGQRLDSYETHDADDIDTALGTAQSAFVDWRSQSMAHRQTLLEKTAQLLEERVDEYAELMTHEMGKPIEQARAEVRKCAWVCEYYAETAAEQLQDELIESDSDARTLVSYDPLGPILAIMPWNFPFWQAFRFIAPNLAAGNVGLLKHASNVPGCALAIEEVLQDAGMPEGVFQTLLISSSEVDDIISDDRVAGVTLTGSEGAGRAVGQRAGQQLKPSVLELGGSDPFVVLDDAPIEATAKRGAFARLQNTGQSCIAAKRFIVHDAIYDDFVEAFVDEVEALTVGDPTDEDTDIGPMARPDLRDDLDDQIDRTLEAGAELLTGGEAVDGEGAYYQPTVLTEVPRDSAAATEETFGPVASVIRVSDETEAIDVANDTDFGLGASVWTSDLDRGEVFARQFEAGLCFVNELVKSDPRLPFGGVKNSGYGRELSRHGIREFVNAKTIWVQHGLGEDDTSDDSYAGVE